ncbi:MAG: hypothetical protein GY947_10110 [Rhodobacteraceae bacterium]|nr:hypothetical protein [Paracoccaceae bacterium]
MTCNSTRAPGASLTSIISAVIRTLKAVSARRIVVVTRYLDAVNTTERDFLQAAGFEVMDHGGRALAGGEVMAAVG